MKAYRVTLLIIDFDRLGAEGIPQAIENARYGNDCIIPRVMSIEEADIGEWSDDHPLNKREQSEAEFDRLFVTTEAASRTVEMLTLDEARFALSIADQKQEAEAGDYADDLLYGIARALEHRAAISKALGEQA